MKHAALVVAILATFSAEAFADTANSNSASGAASNSTSNSYGNVGNATTNTMTPTANAASNASTASNSQASNNGNTQVIQFITPPPPTTSTQNLNTSTLSRSENVISGSQEQYIDYGGSYTIKNVPSVNGPPLTTANDTCMGSSSGSINGPGFGIGLGSTWTDRNCMMLKNARELWNMGMKAAAMALMCTDSSNRMALEITGFGCPQTLAARQASAQAERQASVLRENAELKARLAALQSEAPHAQTVGVGWFGRRSNPSAEAMLPRPVTPLAADPAAPVETRKEEQVQAAPPIEARRDEPAAVGKVEITPIPDARIESTAEAAAAQPVVVRVVSDPQQ